MMQQGFLRFAGFVAILLCLSFSEIFGQTTYFSRNSGSAWNAASSWSTVAFDNPTNTGTFPVAGDFVFIGGTGSNISISAAAACATLSIASGSFLTVNEGLDVSGTTSVGGVLFINSTAGTKTFGGLVTVAATGQWFELVNEPIVFQGGLTNGGLFLASNGLHTFGAAQTISGTLLIPRVRMQGGGVFQVTNAGTLTVTDLIGTDGLLQGSGAVLNIGGLSTIATMDASTNPNTVNYTGAGQTVNSNDFDNLTLSGSGTVTLQGGTANIGGNFTIGGSVSTSAVTDLTIGGNMSIGVGTSFTAGSFTHAIAGDWTNSGTFNEAGSTINFNGAGQNITGGSTSFNELILSGTGTKTLGLGAAIAGTLSIESGAIAGLDNANIYTSNLLALGGPIQASGTWGSTSSAAANQNDTFFSGTGLITVASTANNFFSIASTDWGLNTTWSNSGFGGGAAASTPGAGDFVFIGGGNTVTVSGVETCEALTFDAGTSVTNTLTISNSLTVATSVTIPQTVTSGSNIMNVGSGSLTVSNLDFTATGSGAGHELTISTGTATITGSITGIGASSTISFTGAGTLEVGGTMLTPASGTLTTSAGSTVDYNGGSDQAVEAFTYENLALSGSGNKSLVSNTTIGGNLTVNNGSTFTIGAVTLAVTGTTTVDGTLSITSNSGTKTFTGLVTVNGTGTWTNTNEIVAFQGGLTNNGTFTAGTGRHDFTAAQTISGTLTLPTVRMQGGGVFQVTNAGTLTVTDLIGADGLLQGSGAVLNISGLSTIATMDASTNPNTVNYTGAGQTVNSIDFDNLTLSGSGVVTLQGGTANIGGNLTLGGSVSTSAVTDLAIGGNMSIGVGTSFTAGSFTHTIAGDWTNSGTFNEAGSTINFNGAGQNITGGSTSFNELILSGTGTKTLGLGAAIAGTLSIESGAIAGLDNANIYTSNLLALGGPIQAAGTWGSTSSAATNQNDTFFSGTGLITVASTANNFFSIASTDWGLNTTWSNSGFGGGVAASTPGAGDFVFIGGGNTVTVSGVETCEALTFDAGTSVTNTLTISNSLTVATSVTIPQTVTSGSNILNVGSGSLTVSNLDFTATGSGAGHELTISTGTATVSGSITGIGASSTISFTGAGTLEVGGTMLTPASGTLTTSAGSTVDYNGGSDQAVEAFTYENLALSGSGNKSLVSNTTIGGNLTVNNGSTFTIGAVTLAVTGATTVDGTLSITSNSGTKTFTGLVTVSGTGTWTNTNEIVNFQGGLTNNGTFTAGTGRHDFTAAQTISGTLTLPTVRMQGGGVFQVTNAGTLTVTDLIGADGLLQGSGAVLNISGLSTIATMDASMNPNTVNYTGAGQTVNSNDFDNLTLSGSGAVTLQGGTANIGGNFTIGGSVSTSAVTDLSIGGNMSIGGGTSFTAGSFTHTIAGDWTNGGTFDGTGSTINFNGSGQNITGGSTTFNELILSGTGTKTLGLSAAITGTLSIETGAIAGLDNANTYTSNLLALAGPIQAAGTWGSTSSAPPAANQNDTFFSGTGLITVASSANNFFSIASGPWNDPNTWSNSGFGGAAGLLTPGAGDYVFIGSSAGGRVVAITSSETCEAITFDEGQDADNTLFLGGGGDLTVTGAITISRKSFAGRTNRLFVGTQNVTAGSLDFAGAGSGNQEIDISTGVVTISGNITGVGASSTVIFSGAGLLQVGGTFFAGSSGTLTAGTGTVEYNGAAQTIEVFSYNNLTLSGSGTKTPAGNLTVGAALNVGGGTTLDVSGVTFAVTGTTTIDGAFTITNNPGTKTFGGLITVNGSWNNTNENVTVQGGGITNNGTFNAGTGTYIFNSTSQDLNGTFTMNNVTVNGGANVLTNNGSLTVNNALSGSGTLTQGSSAVLNIGGSSAITGLIASASGNTVNYSGAAQAIRAIAYENLGLSGSSNKTVTSGLTIGGAFSIGTGTTFIAGSFTHNVGGDWNNAGTFDETGSTINFNGAGAQDISGNSTFENIQINSAGTVTLTASQNLRGLLSLGATASFDAGSGLLTLLSTSDTQSASIGEIQGGATFSGSVNVQRFMGAEGSFNRYVSSPVTGALLSDLANTFALVNDFAQTYNEPAAGGFNGGYANVGLGSTLVSGKGYLVFPTLAFASGDITWDVSGPLTSGSNQGDVNLNVTYTDNADPGADGWNLVGNPYPSTIVWDGNLANWDIQDIEPIVYVPDIANPSYFMSYDYSTGLGVPGLGTLVNGEIALGQAFWVKAQGPALSPNLVVRESAKTSSSGEFYRRRSKENVGLSVTLSDNIGKDVSWLLTRPDASNGYDLTYDRSKLEAPALSISFVADGRKLVNSTVSELESVIPLSVRVASAGEFSISFEEIGTLDEYSGLYLIDRHQGIAHNISSGTYTFTAEEGEMSDRFLLSRNASGEVEVGVYPNPVVDKVTVTMVSQQVASVRILDMAGAKVREGNTRANDLQVQAITFDVSNLARGIYLVSAEFEGKIITRKIVKN